MSYSVGVSIDLTLRVGAPNLVLAPFSTSIILPLVGSPAATLRANDTAQVQTLSNINYSATEGTILCEFAVQGIEATVNPRIWQFDDGTSNNRISCLIESSTGNIRLQVVSGGVTQCNIDSGVTVTANTFYKVACSWKADSFRIAVNGVGAIEYTSGSIPTVTTLNIGRSPGSAALLNGWIRKLPYMWVQMPQTYLNEWSGA